MIHCGGERVDQLTIIEGPDIYCIYYYDGLSCDFPDPTPQ